MFLRVVRDTRFNLMTTDVVSMRKIQVGIIMNKYEHTVLLSCVFMVTVFIFILRGMAACKAKVINFVDTEKQITYSLILDLCVLGKFQNKHFREAKQN